MGCVMSCLLSSIAIYTYMLSSAMCFFVAIIGGKYYRCGFFLCIKRAVEGAALTSTHLLSRLTHPRNLSA